MPDKITKEEFVKKIKTKYPEYRDVDDTELTERMLTKYPEYKSSIIDGAGGGFSRFKQWLANIWNWLRNFPRY